MDKSQIKNVEEITENLLSLLQLDAKIVSVESEDDVISITLSSEEGGIIIGHHGETLEALQRILSLCLAKKLEKFYRISLEIGDYKKNRMEWLQQVTSQAKEKALQDNASISLPHLKSWERRVVHTMLHEDTEVVSESMGEGRERTLTIRPKA